MGNLKKGEEKENLNSVVLEIENLEKGINSLKKELEFVLKKNNGYEKEKVFSKEVIEKLIESYNLQMQKIKDYEKNRILLEKKILSLEEAHKKEVEELVYRLDIVRKEKVKYSELAKSIEEELKKSFKKNKDYEKEISEIKKAKEKIDESLKNETFKSLKLKKDIDMSKNMIEKLVISYEKRIKEKDEEIVKEKEFSKNLSKSYEGKIKAKDDEIKNILLTGDDSPNVIKELEKLGISKEIMSLKRIELCKRLDFADKQNKEILKKFESLDFDNKRLKSEFKVLKDSFSKSFKDMENDFKRVNSEKIAFETKNDEYAKSNDTLKRKMLDLIKVYENKIEALKIENEKRVIEILNEASRKEIDYRSKNAVLEKRIEEYREVLSDSENNREKLIKAVEERIKSSISPLLTDAIINKEKIREKK